MSLWTDEEEEILRKFYPKVGSELTLGELSEILGKTVPAIQDKAKRSGIRIVYQSNINYELLEQLEKRITL